VFLRDEGSRHGTTVNGVPIPGGGAVARFGDVVRVGDVLLLVVADVERSAARPRRNEGAWVGLPESLIAGPELAEVWDEARRAAALREPVLVTGETGSGKECIARMLHGERAKPGPFVALNVSAVPNALFEAELFGYERGAFTGAEAPRLGAFREAGDGLLFLDEVGELKLENQSKLLRVLDGGRVRPLGSKGDVAVSARVVSATSRDLEQACDAGDFRSDLYYRLSGLVIRVPPLRERRGDILLIALEVLRQCSPRLTLSTDAAELLAIARWEGNARQLRHAVIQAAHRAGTGAESLLPEHLGPLTRSEGESDKLTLERIEQAFVECGGIASHAARKLGVSRTTLYKALRLLRPEKSEAPDTDSHELGQGPRAAAER
jgi:DNA-binding NtrC family response regulator